MALHQWALATRTFRKMFGGDGGSTGVDETFAVESFANVGAWILGRNMFGPVRGPWLDDSWKGWWGPEPSYHAPVFVLTHHARAPLVMEGGTTFFFVTDGIESALEQAKAAAQGKDVRISGGAYTIKEYISAGLIDEFTLHIAPMLLGEGVRLLDRFSRDKLKLEQVSAVGSKLVTHVTYRVVR